MLVKTEKPMHKKVKMEAKKDKKKQKKDSRLSLWKAKDYWYPPK